MRAILLGVVSAMCLVGGLVGAIILLGAFLICWPVPILVGLFYWWYIRRQCRKQRVSVRELRSYGRAPRYPKVHPSPDHGDRTPSALDNPTWL